MLPMIRLTLRATLYKNFAAALLLLSIMANSAQSQPSAKMAAANTAFEAEKWAEAARRNRCL